MAGFESGFDYGTGRLTASRQADSLAGGGGFGLGGGPDAGGLLGLVLSERRRREAREDAQRAQARRDMEMERQRAQAGQFGAAPRSRGFGPPNKMREVADWEAFQEGTMSPAQRATSMAGGMQGQAYSDMARRMAALAAAGVPVGEYTGFTELAKAGSGASAQAEAQAGENLRQRRAQQQLAALGG